MLFNNCLVYNIQVNKPLTLVNTSIKQKPLSLLLHFIKVCPVHVLSNHLCYVPVLKFTPFVTQDKIHYRKSSTYRTSYLRGKQFEQIVDLSVDVIIYLLSNIEVSKFSGSTILNQIN